MMENSGKHQNFFRVVKISIFRLDITASLVAVIYLGRTQKIGKKIKQFVLGFEKVFFGGQVGDAKF